MGRTLAALLVLAALAGCRHNIPDTDIADTPDTRALIAVIDDYRKAAERRDADAVMALVSTSYFDNAGTADPSDDMDYAQLAKALKQDYARLPSTRLDLQVRRIDVDGAKATADLFYDTHYRISTPRGEIQKADQDSYRMTFRKEDGAWRITAGL